MRSTIAKIIEKGGSEIAKTNVLELITAVGLSPDFTIAANILIDVFSGKVGQTVNSVFRDVKGRQLSVSQSNRVDDMFRFAHKRFIERVSKDNSYLVASEINVEHILEYAEGMILKAINENQRRKIEIMGNFLGETMYSGESDMHLLQQISNTLSKLSWRQVVMVKLISERFPGCNLDLIPTNHSAAIEINELQQYGFWQSEGARFGINNSVTYRLKDIVPTEYCRSFVLLTGMDIISKEDKCEVVKSLSLGNGTPPEIHTKKDLELQWKNVDGGVY